MVGGGSGGHFYPLMAVAEALRDAETRGAAPETQLYYMGPGAYDPDALGDLNIVFVSCPAGKWRRYFSLQNFLDILKTAGGFFVALGKLFALYPDAVMSKGGYTSVPVVVAAWCLRIPVIIHESDVRPGISNKIGGKLATNIGISYKETAEFFPPKKTALVGIPIRKVFYATPMHAPYTTLGTSGQWPLITVLGGSLGAGRVNDIVLASLPLLLPKYEIFHQTGKIHEVLVNQTADALVTNREERARYHVRGFVDQLTMKAAYESASVVIARAGSTTIAEIALFAVPSILIPIPEEVSHDQRTNAYAYARTGAASVLEEENLTPHLLAAEIERIMSDPALQEKMRAGARGFAVRESAARLAEALANIGYEHER